MNLTAIKRDVFHDAMDLYVINASNMVEFTTYPPDQDLDFNTEPDFAEYLNGIRNTSGFYPDRVVREVGSNILRKYAYAPTSDHRYILELGLIGDTFKSERQRLTYTETIKDIKSLNPYLEDARLFTQFKSQVGNSSFKPDAELKARLDRVIDEQDRLRLDLSEDGQQDTVQVHQPQGRGLRLRSLDGRRADLQQPPAHAGPL